MARERPAYQDRIVCDPQIMAGKPVVRGTRIPVELVLQHLEENPDLEDLFAAFPRLTREDVKACLAYARSVLENDRCRAPRRQAAPTSTTVERVLPREIGAEERRTAKSESSDWSDLSNTSFARDWDSEADSAYDRLR